MRGLANSHGPWVLAVACVGAGLSAPAEAAMPVLSKQVQAFVVQPGLMLAIAHVRVIDGNGTPAKEDQTPARLRCQVLPDNFDDFC